MAPATETESSVQRNMTTFRQLLLLLLIPAVFASILAISASAGPSSSSQRPGGRSLDFELHHLKLKVAQLESILSESISNLSAKSIYLDGRERLIAETSEKIQLLQFALDLSESDKRLRNLEEEVRLLWAELRKNNFHLHVLETRAKETDDALKVLTSRVKKLADIVSEQWIQIQHLEQAFQITKMRTLEARSQVSSSQCTFLKLQDCIKKLMERTEVTATLTNKEFIFFMASVVVVFPVMTAWLWLSSRDC